MISFEEVGTETADLVLDVLNGKHPSTLAPRMSDAHAYRVDARQLERWSLSEKNLPADTVVLFKQPTLWERHRKLVLATIGAFGAMATILGNLLLQMTRRRRAEASLKESEERMMFAAASTHTGLWQYDVPSKAPMGDGAMPRHVRSGCGCATRGGDISAPCSSRRSSDRDGRDPGGHHRRRNWPREANFASCTRTVETRWILASGKTHFDDEGKPVKVSGVFRDVTSRKIAEHETEQLSRRLSTIQDEERQQIAEELHDSTTQHLVAVGLNMMSLQQSRRRRRREPQALQGNRGLPGRSDERAAHLHLSAAPAAAREGRPEIRAAPLRRWLRQANQARDQAQDQRQGRGAAVLRAASPAARGSGGLGQRASSRFGIEGLHHRQMRGRPRSLGGRRRWQRRQWNGQTRAVRVLPGRRRHSRHDGPPAPGRRRPGDTIGPARHSAAWRHARPWQRQWPGKWSRVRRRSPNGTFPSPGQGGDGGFAQVTHRLPRSAGAPT